MAASAMCVTAALAMLQVLDLVLGDTIFIWTIAGLYLWMYRLFVHVLHLNIKTEPSK